MQYTGYVKDGTTGVPAVEYARRIIFDGMGCDIPNIQLLMRVLSDADFIDSMDDTVKSCPQTPWASSIRITTFTCGPAAIPAAISGHQPIRMQTASFTLTK